MAFLQTDLPPSRAPHSSRRAGKAIAITAVRKSSSALFIRIALVLLGAALLVVPGYFAAEATESLAVGILAGDLAFLIAVAGWSSVSGGRR